MEVEKLAFSCLGCAECYTFRQNRYILVPWFESQNRKSTESALCLLIGLLATGRMEVALQMYLNSFANLKFSMPREVAALFVTAF